MGLLEALKQYASDAAGGSLNPEVGNTLSGLLNYGKDRARYIGGLLDDSSPINKDFKNWHDRTQLGLADLIAGKEGPQADYGYSQIMNMAGNAPMGIMKMGPDWIGKVQPSLDKLAKNKDKFLYHSSDPANLDSLHYGIEPQQGGPWVREVANGTGVDDVEEMLSQTTPLAWMSDSPSWVKSFVSRVSGKPLSSVTPDDIEKYGHLAIINKKAPDTGNIYKIGAEGLSNGEYSMLENLRGKKMKAYETPLYGEDNFGNKLEPFGVERSEYVTTDSVSPMLQLTGKELVEFLRKAGLLAP